MDKKNMHVLSIVYIVLAVVLLIFFVIISFSFLGLFLSELGLWFSWIPLGLLISSIPFLVMYSAEHPRYDFFILLVSAILNLISYIRLMMPFFKVTRTNNHLKETMKESLGEDYLDYIDPTLNTKFFKKVRFRLSHYFAGANYKKLDNYVETVNDIPYKEIGDTTLELNVYYPKEDGIYPIVIYVHGGGWMRGSKDRYMEMRILKRLAYMGYTVFNIDYRLAPLPNFKTLKNIPHDYPTIREMVSDVRASIIHAKQNAAKYKGDKDSLFLFGRSAGAHLVLLTSFSCSQEFFDMEGITCSIDTMDMAGVVALYPITDIDELYKFYDKDAAGVFKQSIYRGAGGNLEETKNLFKILSPINYVTDENKSRIPPVFLSAGIRDRIVDVYQSQELANELSKAGVKNVYLEFPWANHGFDAAINGPGGQLVFQYMSQFLVWAITQKRVNEIETLANKAGLQNAFAKEKLKVISEIRKGSTNKEIEQLLKV